MWYNVGNMDTHERKLYMQEYRRKRKTRGLCVRCGNQIVGSTASWCKSCQDKHKAWQYGITVAELDLLYDAQDNRCAACGEIGTLVIDHSHSTGKVRGFLCQDCNITCGYLETPRAKECAEYLARTN